MRHLLISALILLAFLATALAADTPTPAPATHDSWLYVGNYGKQQPKGIYLFRMNGDTGKLTPAGLAAEAPDPNFLALHPSGKFLYAVTTRKLAPDYAGALEAFALDPATGKLTFLNRVPSGGAEPVHVAVDPSGKCAVVANYSGSSVAAFPIRADGQLGEAASVVKHAGSSIDPSRQKQPYPHGVAFDRAGKHVLVADLGTDKVIVYDIDPAKATLTRHAAATITPGSGPRHLAFSEDGKLVYVVSEMSNTVTVFAYADGGLREPRTVSPWQDAVKGKDYAAEVAVAGQSVYVSLRGRDSIAVLDGTNVLQKIDCGGKSPRHFALTPDGRFLVVANQKSNSVTVLARDQEKGTLHPSTINADVPAPVCVLFVPIK